MNQPIEIFETKDAQIQLQVSLQDQSVWLNRHQLALLFDRDIKTIGKHIANVFKDEELEKMQLSQILRQLPRMAKPIKLSTTT
ncbi:hypothetical protein [Thiomicrorhabdus aquaedulcis]|uniref:hypothetical protein n=1 Tax=Thiomicrorhabdus aquaedulcis TaxID=2211106 RepID=UPI0018D54138|nr:hypothetical protein [Thiomicrorhabdus aquaedulcis]